MFKLFPDLTEDLLIQLFHKGVKSSWTTDDVAWDDDMSLSEAQCEALAHVLTPVYLGEQSAMLGAAAVLPQLAQAGEATAQVYLASFIMDEARHFEVLTQLYRRMGQYPMAIRAMPEMLRYHHRLRQGDRVHWVWGILISDLFAKNFYQLFAKSQPDALFGKMSSRILQDESRHQAFASRYLTRAWPGLSPAHRRSLVEARDDLLGLMHRMMERLEADTGRLEIDGRAFLERLEADIDHHARKIGFFGPDGPGGGASGGAAGDRTGGRVVAFERRVEPVGGQQNGAHECGTCFLSALCSSKLVQKARIAR